MPLTYAPPTEAEVGLFAKICEVEFSLHIQLDSQLLNAVFVELRNYYRVAGVQPTTDIIAAHLRFASQQRTPLIQ